ncbi:ATP-binding protein [Candidatus Halobeggiatoa sp. HSG11]|nr:ATP-binding protein [Candidatus Halobeggiatoa sp. HSG11]
MMTNTIPQEILSNLSEVILTINLQTNEIEACNYAVENIFGYKEQELIKQNVSILHINNDTFQQFLKKLNTSLGVKFEFQMQRKNGELFMAEHFYIQQENEIIGIINEINQSELLKKQLADCTTELTIVDAQLSQASRLKDELLANISHELRTPLNGILGITDALQEEAYETLNEQQIKFLQTITDNGNKLLAIINGILSLAKIDAGKVTLDITSVMIETIANVCQRITSKLSNEKNISVFNTSYSEITVIQADERCLKEILLNLITNAIKFTPDGGSVNLTVCGYPEHEAVDLIISDTGIGIADKDMELLFQPFVQLNGGLDRIQGGTGLGLSLVYRFVEMHGGSITLESEVGKGSSFTVSLPWQPEHPVQNNLTAISQQNVTILLIDDNFTVTDSLSELLTSKGYQVIVAFDGLQAIKKVLEVNIDLIIMDIQMPEMDGIEAITTIRAKGFEIPIIAITALVVTGSEEQCLEIGANAYFKKPVNFSELEITITKLL